MPIYEFRCQECSKVSEFQLKMADPHPQDCPGCGKGALKKIMSLPSFQLKGGGWYAEAYDGPSNKKSGGEAPSSEAKADSKADVKTESKPEAKAEPKAEAKTETKAAPAPSPSATKT